MNLKFFNLLFIFLLILSSFAVVVADNTKTITNATSVNYGNYTTYTINYNDGTNITGNITNNQTNNLANNQTVEISGEILDFELEPNEPKSQKHVTMKSTGLNYILIGIMVLILLFCVGFVYYRNG